MKKSTDKACPRCGHNAPLPDGSGACGYCDSDGPCTCPAWHLSFPKVRTEEEDNSSYSPALPSWPLAVVGTLPGGMEPPEPDFVPGGGSFGGAGASASWEPATTEPSPSYEPSEPASEPSEPDSEPESSSSSSDSSSSDSGSSSDAS
jgi:hypothetical protein